MAGPEAMRLYVRTLEEEKPDWWTPEVATAFEAQEQEKSTNGTESTDSTKSAATTPIPNSAPLHPSPSAVNSVPVKSRSVAEVVVEGSWVSPYIASDRRPPPRYEQAMALVGNHLYIIGGNCGGRYLADTWALNLENLIWRCVYTGKSPAAQKITQSTDAEIAPGGDTEAEEKTALVAQPVFSPVAGHAAVHWNGNVLSIGGHSKAKNAIELPVHLLDTQTGTWSRLEPTFSADAGIAPGPRGSHTATVVGTKAYVFGGEDSKRKSIDELWSLDLSTMEWDRPATSGITPSARSAHTACAFRNRYIVIFGGGSVATCFDDLVILDTQTMEWIRPETEGPIPPPRAGHASAVLGSTLYIVGGGNNARGCADMYALDLSNLGAGEGPLHWTLVGNTPAESAIAAEGLSLLCIPMAGCMVSFGGYNGRYHNAVHVYRPEGFVVVKTGQAPGVGGGVSGAARGGATPNTAGSAQQGLGRREASDVSLGAGGGAGLQSGGVNASSQAAELEAARRETAAVKEGVALEISIMRRQLDSATSALAEAERAAEEAREALENEQQRGMALEVEVAELRQKLVAMEDIEKELTRYRQRAAEDASKKPGLWGFITGADQAAGEKPTAG